MFRHALAFLIAPLAAVLFFWAAFVFEAWRYAGSDLQNHNSGLFGVLLFLGLPSYAAALLFGFPTLVLFRALRLQGLTVHCSATLLIGLVVGLYCRLGWDFTVLCCVAGVLSGFLYWLLAFRLLAAIEASEAKLYGS